MRWTLALSLGLLVVGCNKRREITDLPEADEGPRTLLGCPDDALEYGAAPPAGTEMWCARFTSSGTTTRHGPTRTWYADGRLKEAGAYADGDRTGHWWFYATDGHLEREGDFLKGLEDGYWLYYAEDGSVASEGPMKDGGRDGVWVTRDERTGIPVEGLWVDGQKEGVWVEYDAEGNPTRERVFRRGRLISQREL